MLLANAPFPNKGNKGTRSNFFSCFLLSLKNAYILPIPEEATSHQTSESIGNSPRTRKITFTKPMPNFQPQIQHKIHDEVLGKLNISHNETTLNTTTKYHLYYKMTIIHQIRTEPTSSGFKEGRYAYTVQHLYKGMTNPFHRHFYVCMDNLCIIVQLMNSMQTVHHSSHQVLISHHVN